MRLSETGRRVFEIGDRVTLLPETGHEGPHPSDVDAVAPKAQILDVQFHPNNEDWPLEYLVLELEDQECLACTGTGAETTDPTDASRCLECGGRGHVQCWTEARRVKAGVVWRLA